MSAAVRPGLTTASWGSSVGPDPAALDGRPGREAVAAPDGGDRDGAHEAEVHVRWRSGLLALSVLGAALVAAFVVTHEPTTPGTVIAADGTFATVLVADDPHVRIGDVVSLESATGVTVDGVVDATSHEPAIEQHALVIEAADLAELGLEDAPVVTVTTPARPLARSLVGR